MSENGESVARSSYGGPRCRQLTSIQAPGSWRIVLRRYLPWVSTPQRTRSSGMKNPRGRYPGLLGIMSCYRTVWDSFRFVARIDI